MRKIGIFLIGTVCVILFYFMFISASKVFTTDWELPSKKRNNTNYRVVLITQDLETPFWDKVGEGALEQAQNESIDLEVWGSYGDNQEDFLKKIEIAIYSQVDGIIVQGLDTDGFKELTKIKAASFGIPIITVVNDIPMDESLRRTYVGSDQHLAGKLIAEQLIEDMGSSGNIVLISDSKQQYYQRQRIQGIKDVLKDYPDMKIIDAETADSREQVIATTKDILNTIPNTDAFIAVNANISGGVIQEIESRSQVDKFHIYSFDNDSESMALLKEGKLDGMIEQSPKKMGTLSVQLLARWLNNEKVPLGLNGYYTDIHILKAMNEK